MHNIASSNNIHAIRQKQQIENINTQPVTNPVKAEKQCPEKLWSSLAVMSSMNKPFLGSFKIKMANCDGKIGEFKQGAAGDCWLLSGLKSLSCSPLGAEIIKDAITKNDDGSVTVNFKGVNVSYTITEDEFNKARDEYITSPDGIREKKYSDYDSDVLIFELAAKKYRTDISEGKFKDAKIPNYAKILLDKDNPTDGGTSGQVYYLLTGKPACTISTHDVTRPDNGKVLLKSNKEKLNEFIEKYCENNKNYAATFNVHSPTEIPDLTGRMIKFNPKHEYAVEGSIGPNIIISNPHDSARKIIISKENFIQITSSLDYQNLKDNNDSFDLELQKYVIKYTAANNYINENF